TSHPLGQTGGDRRVTMSLRCERQFTYFLINVLFVIFSIVLLSPIALTIDADQIADRMGLILTVVLTVVTFKFAINNEIPKTSTVTRLDIYIIISFCILLAIVVETLVCKMISKRYWTALDRTLGWVLCTFWIGFHVWIVNNAYNGTFYTPWEEMRDEDALREKKLLMTSPSDINLSVQ
ncbi:hypothetical protein HDV03_002436, partial [Kappamyces sp. JEL0829]